MVGFQIAIILFLVFVCIIFDNNVIQKLYHFFFGFDKKGGCNSLIRL